ncbi:hypothetical protein PP353_gp58 [Arthrobacter phage Kumotta]|uniref:Uncharacterized protein n=2 Tax=Kumottavirus TaxID=3044749 RepID=A0A4Y6ENH0_9CAUD|nr:hypothetical protein PP353_gp58 [Arthrobacter phage Kumotta]QDF19567.1 hypothetical protein SEA_KUMOTTA_58 [Arthrobacter phage Kumotta]
MTPDPCCFMCRSATGVCLTRFQCDHHKDADKRDEANHQARRTYNDPTSRQAVNNVLAAQRRRKPR